MTKTNSLTLKIRSQNKNLGVFALNRRQEKQEAHVKEAGVLLRVFCEGEAVRRTWSPAVHVSYRTSGKNPVYRPFLLARQLFADYHVSKHLQCPKWESSAGMPFFPRASWG